MASSGDGVGHLRSTSLVSWEGEGTSTPSRDGCDRKGLRIPQAVIEDITRVFRIIAEPGWDSELSPYWICNTTKKYVKMYYIDKLFPKTVWSYNHKNSSVKPKESKFKYFEYRALEVWSALYPNKSFGPENKNIISYSIMVMAYAEIELKKTVNWQTVLTGNKEDRMEYTKADIFDNFNFFRQNVGNGPVPDARGANQNTHRSKKSVQDKDSVGKAICFKKSKSRSENEEKANASKKLDSAIPRLVGDV